MATVFPSAAGFTSSGPTPAHSAPPRPTSTLRPFSSPSHFPACFSLLPRRWAGHTGLSGGRFRECLRPIQHTAGQHKTSPASPTWPRRSLTHMVGELFDSSGSPVP
ncbi:hypothetical protein E2C01_081211 [Portunus trituberculatus]|uniref:Uncharacterized protein n=1 Tax=Portunus trituberculatus TaxID=210409 RepID=A0A5B7IXC7_PORTR|nr:hypothetical protein [Portunus trituberculatus]